MLRIGCHLSNAKGYLHMGREITRLGGSTFQFFSRNPRGGSVKENDPEDLADFLAYSTEHGIGPIVAHAPYTLNACSPKPEVRQFARTAMADDLARLAPIPNIVYNFHPGSRVGQELETAIGQIADMLNEILTPETSATVLLETMSGKGSEVGGSFEELREIIDRVYLAEKLGVCLDTCHVSDAGYDIVNDPDGVLTAFDRVIGLERLRALHVNDSKNPCGARKDRHEKIGLGTIGTDAIVRLLEHPALRGLPAVLETPNEPEGYAAEIALLKERWR